MFDRNRLRVGIVGGGPSGSALAILLARKGCEVALWNDGKNPDLVVGESLIPAVVPILRKLGIESEVAAISIRKPGVTFEIDPERAVRFSFTSVAGILPPYAYNVPRPQFDHLLSHRAAHCGATLIRDRAKITYDPDSDVVSLDPISLESAGWKTQPDLIVDATGRARLFARTIAIPHRDGPRKDIAHFAHFTDVPPLPGDPPGQVTIARSLLGGWSWRIPLQNATSVGTVLPNERTRSLGESPAERLESAIASDPILAPVMANARRISDVATYANYQRISERAWGKNWVLLGDALGFVDPMLSSGLCLALSSAHWLADVLPNRTGIPLAPATECYAARFYTELEAWSELIQHFYGGTIFNLYFADEGSAAKYRNPLSKSLESHVSKHISCMCAGAATSRKYSQNLVKFATDHGADPAKATHFAIA